MNAAQKREAAVDELLEAGCKNEKKEDRQGDTRSGWWQDDVFLAKDPILALQILKG